ncbi:MAG: RT0821/Lpp0805 family surface protein [Nitrospinota bacterium]
MRKTGLIIALLALSLAAWTPQQAAADPPWAKRGYKYRDEHKKFKEEYKKGGCEYEYESGASGYKMEKKCGSGPYTYEEEYKRGGCEYEYKSGPYGYKEERECKGRGWAKGGPPPWAPAHGRRRKFGRPGAYVVPFGIDLGRCNRELIGRVLGGAAGGVLGSTIGKGSGKTAATIGGAILGVIVGGAIGRSLDELDRACVGQVLEHAQSGQTVVWRNPDTGAQYQVRPTKTYQDRGGRYCREYYTTTTIGGKAQQVYGTACRQPDGSWQLVN